MNKVERHMDICKHLNGVYERKNHDYGDSFHDTFVEEGMAMARIRLSDKLGRFKKLSKAGSEQKVNDESIRDTLLDLANYAIMTVMEMDILEEEEAKAKLKATIREHRNNLMELGRSSVSNKTFQIPQNSITNSDHTCPACGSKLEFHPEMDKYICGQCGMMFSISALNGAPEIGEDPCKKCTYTAKETCGGCIDRSAWEERRRKGGDLPPLNDDDPCKECNRFNTAFEKTLCFGCDAKLAWEKKQRRSDTDAVESEPVDDDPCEICGKTVIDKAACCGCPERLEWEKRQRRSDTDAVKDEQADGR